jgi:hypothetical protein
MNWKKNRTKTHEKGPPCRGPQFVSVRLDASKLLVKQSVPCQRKDALNLGHWGQIRRATARGNSIGLGMVPM